MLEFKQEYSLQKKYLMSIFMCQELCQLMMDIVRNKTVSALMGIKTLSR